MVTIKDVAALAGVSTSTASRAMHNNKVISDETKQLVFNAMKELGYEPNYAARNLANKTSNTIGVILPVAGPEIFQNPFFMEIIRGINQECNQRQYMVTIASGDTNEELADNVATMVKRGRIQNFILLYSKVNDPVVTYLHDQKIGYTVVGKPVDYENETPYVDNDNILAAKDATEYLIQAGHQNICFVYNNEEQLVSLDRFTGYRRAIRSADLANEYQYQAPVDTSPTDVETFWSWLSEHPEVTGFVTSDDIVGLMVQQTINQTADIPRKVVSFNNSLFSQMSSPAFSSIDIHAKQLGIEAVSLMMKYIDNKNSLVSKIIVPHRLIVRD
ncbi:LacI family DNA-binding transcriptional regulator [Brochothrix thermosphacta]|uniref:LacI family DNA-binding transcriptional regulator n=1 Tax=Brochothrix thermosphacta TaxID=2756 RepID=UPI000D799812|nr:LacI family DNA-binding transcriptional regulator [Brochothrix thermosphacta]SPN75279.1 putative transcriptional repressor MalR, LacI family [Brochothrix thermosphacta]